MQGYFYFILNQIQLTSNFALQSTRIDVKNHVIALILNKVLLKLYFTDSRNIYSNVCIDLFNAYDLSIIQYSNITFTFRGIYKHYISFSE